MRRLATATIVFAIAAFTIYCGETLPAEEPTPSEAGADASVEDSSGDQPIDTNPSDPCTAVPPKGVRVVETGIKPTRIVTDGYQLFFSGGITIERLTLGVDAGATTFVTTNFSVNGLALTNDHLVFLNGPTMLATPKSAPDPLLQIQPPPDWQPLLAAQGSYGVGAALGNIHTLHPPDLSPTTLIGVNNPTALAIYNTRVAYIANNNGAPAVHTAVFNTNAKDLFDAGAATPVRVALDDAHVFVADDAGNVWSVELGSNNRVGLASGQSTTISTMRLRGNYVYFASPAGVRRVAKTGGCVQRIADGPAADFDVTDTQVFWVNGADVLGAPLP